MDNYLDKLLILSFVYLTYMEISLSFQYILMTLTIIGCWALNRYLHLFNEIDYFPDDVTFLDTKKAYR